MSVEWYHQKHHIKHTSKATHFSGLGNLANKALEPDARPPLPRTVELCLKTLPSETATLDLLSVSVNEWLFPSRVAKKIIIPPDLTDGHWILEKTGTWEAEET